jgi:hypothetical protein
MTEPLRNGPSQLSAISQAMGHHPPAVSAVRAAPGHSGVEGADPPVVSLRTRVSAAVDRAFAALAVLASSANFHLAGMATIGIITMPGSLLTGMVAYAALLHARLPLLTLQTLADRILAADAGGTRLMLGLLLSGWTLLGPLLSRSSSVSFLSGPAHALFGLIPMLVGCLLARLAMEEHPAIAAPPAAHPQ